MHDCPWCGQACDCDGEDTWHDWPFNADCRHECELDYDDDVGPYYDDDAPDSEYGRCLHCGAAIQNFGAHSDGDGDLYDLIGCPDCGEVMEKVHASSCQCPECV